MTSRDDPTGKPLCISCGCELSDDSVRRVKTDRHDDLYGPLCPACAQPLLDGMPFDDWLNEMETRQRTS